MAYAFQNFEKLPDRYVKNTYGRKACFLKTAEELFKEIDASKDLQNELTSIGKGQFAELDAFLKKHDCGASAREFIDFLKDQKKSQPEGELADDAAESVAGGYWFELPSETYERLYGCHECPGGSRAESVIE